MRRSLFPVIVAFGLVMAGTSSAFAEEPAPTVSVKATPGKKICKITDAKLGELSGIVATRSGFIVINDSTDVASRKRVFFLDDECQITAEVAFSGNGPRDTEDLILSPDGRTLWIADTGDNGVRESPPTYRETIGLWSMPADGSARPKIHRLSYPRGDYHDAEALLLDGDGTPLIVTKEIGKPAYIYQPTGPLQTNNTTGVPLKRVGQITLSATETPGNPFARIGNRSIDGGAIAPGGGRVVLRTYTDALEWDVTGGDVLAALQTKPRTTALPNEPGGEAITYSADGRTFFTVSDMNGDVSTANYIEQYTPATTVAAVKKNAAADSGSRKAWYSDLTIDDINYLVGGVGLLGLILVGAGIIGIVAHRRRLEETGVEAEDAGGPSEADPANELIGVGGTPNRTGNVYHGAPASAPAPAPAPAAARSGPAGSVYGGATAAGGQRGSGVYGGAGGQQQGRPAGGQQQPARGAQQPVRGGQEPVRGGQQPVRGGQQAPVRAGQPPAGGQPRPGAPSARGGQPPPHGGQPPARGGAYGTPPAQQPAPPTRGTHPPAQGPAHRPQVPGGVYGQPAGGADGGRPVRDAYADVDDRPEDRHDNPGYSRR